MTSAIPKGAFGRFGTDTSPYPAAVEHANEVIRAAESAGAAVIFLMNTSLPGGVSDSPAQLRFAWRARPSKLPESQFPFLYTVEGTWGQEFLKALYRPESALTIKKHRSSAFWGTPLDMILRSNAMRTVIVLGCTTEGCVDSTARDAGFLDYFAVVVADAVASSDPTLHDAAMTILTAYRADVITSPDLFRVWNVGAALQPGQRGDVGHGDSRPLPRGRPG